MRRTRPKPWRSVALASPILLLGMVVPVPNARAGEVARRPDLVRDTRHLGECAEELRVEVERTARGGHLRHLGRGQREALEILFGLNRLVTSIDTFLDLAADDGSAPRSALAPAYRIVVRHTRETRDAVRAASAAVGGRGARSAAGGFLSSRLRQSLDALSRAVDDLAYVEARFDLDPHSDLDGRSGRDRRSDLDWRSDRDWQSDRDWRRAGFPRIVQLDCPHRRKYTYRMNVCVEGRALDHGDLRVEFVKRMDPYRGRWGRGFGPDDLVSIEDLGSGLERRCYYLRQIGIEIRRHQRDCVS